MRFGGLRMKAEMRGECNMTAMNKAGLIRRHKREYIFSSAPLAPELVFTHTMDPRLQVLSLCLTSFMMNQYSFQPPPQMKHQ